MVFVCHYRFEGGGEFIAGCGSEGVGNEAHTDEAIPKRIEIVPEVPPVSARKQGIATHRVVVGEKRCGSHQNPAVGVGEMQGISEFLERDGVVTPSIACCVHQRSVNGVVSVEGLQRYWELGCTEAHHSSLILSVGQYYHPQVEIVSVCRVR